MNEDQNTTSGTPAEPTPVPAAAGSVQSLPEQGRQDTTDGNYGDNEFKLEADADRPGEHTATHDEDDDPLSHVGNFVDTNQDGVDDREQGAV